MVVEQAARGDSTKNYNPRKKVLLELSSVQFSFESLLLKTPRYEDASMAVGEKWERLKV
jgi:hypothetical protein